MVHKVIFTPQAQDDLRSKTQFMFCGFGMEQGANRK
jgi:hypothetical protein